MWKAIFVIHANIDRTPYRTTCQAHRRRARARHHRRSAARRARGTRGRARRGAGPFTRRGRGHRAQGAEARRGFNAITVAYSLGALLVLFALGWFLVDRWKVSGPVGVLGVVAALCGGVRRGRRRSCAAGGIRRRRRARDRARRRDDAGVGLGDPASHGRDARPGGMGQRALSLRAVHRVALHGSRSRDDRNGAGGAPAGEILRCSVRRSPWRSVALLLHLGQALGDPRFAWYTGPYYQCVVACAMIAVAYAVERRQPPDEDYAFWVYLAGLVMLAVAYVGVWSCIGRWRHALPARCGRARDRVALPSAPHASRGRWHRGVRLPRLPGLRRVPPRHCVADRARDAWTARDREHRLDAAAFPASSSLG